MYNGKIAKQTMCTAGDVKFKFKQK